MGWSDLYAECWVEAEEMVEGYPTLREALEAVGLSEQDAHARRADP